VHCIAIQCKQAPHTPILSKSGKGRHVYVRARSPAHHVARGRKHCKCMASLYKHMGELQSAITLILRRESKFLKVRSLVSTHSACPCKNYAPSAPNSPRELILLFFYLVCNLSLWLIVKNALICGHATYCLHPVHSIVTCWFNSKSLGLAQWPVCSHNSCCCEPLNLEQQYCHCLLVQANMHRAEGFVL
jgi:hypothetical protein